MKDIKKWYAVYTKPRWEKKVADLLDRYGINNYCPLNRVVKQWSDRKKVIYEPLFNSYVFVQISDNEFTDVKMIDGIINFVHWLGKPGVIKDTEIEAIQNFLKDHNNVQLEKTVININDTVRVINGPLMEKEGSVVMLKGNKVKVLLPSLGFIMSAEIEKSNVEVIKANGIDCIASIN
jgi:transcription antitermination factor NusG